MLLQLTCPLVQLLQQKVVNPSWIKAPDSEITTEMSIFTITITNE